MLQATLQPTHFIEVFILPIIRLRAVSSFSLQSYCARNLNTRAARPFVSSQSLNNNIVVSIALDEIRTGRILGEKADCKQSILSQAQLHIIEPNHKFSNRFSLALMHQSIALRAVTTYRAETYRAEAYQHIHAG